MTASKPKRTVLIIGAGIAGLATAIALARRGWDPEVIDISPDGSTAGWGLSLTGPALRALDTLGLADRCLTAGYGMSVITTHYTDGTTQERPLPRLLGAGRPAMAGIARPELHRILTTEARRLNVAITNGLGISAVDGQPDGVHATLSDGSRRGADLLVGADGLRSRARELLGLGVPIAYTGQMVWRARVPRPQWARGIHTFMSADRQVGIVPLGPEQAYVFMTENHADRNAIPDAELAARMLQMLEPFTGRVAEVRADITDPDAIVRRPVQTVLVEAAWNRGRSVLIGDAAHAPSPQTVSGAALAIEDGVVLAEELDRHGQAEQALKAFVDRRLERCSLLVNTSVQVGALEQEQRHKEAYQLIDLCHARMAQPV